MTQDWVWLLVLRQNTYLRPTERFNLLFVAFLVLLLTPLKLCFNGRPYCHQIMMKLELSLKHKPLDGAKCT